MHAKGKFYNKTSYVLYGRGCCRTKTRSTHMSVAEIKTFNGWLRKIL